MPKWWIALWLGLVLGSASRAEPTDPTCPPPPVTVKGIVLSARGNQAMLETPSRTLTVRQGDKLGDYRVEKIEARGVTFRFGKRTIFLPKQSELPAPTR